MGLLSLLILGSQSIEDPEKCLLSSLGLGLFSQMFSTSIQHFFSHIIDTLKSSFGLNKNAYNKELLLCSDLMSQMSSHRLQKISGNHSKAESIITSKLEQPHKENDYPESQGNLKLDNKGSIRARPGRKNIRQPRSEMASNKSIDSVNSFHLGIHQEKLSLNSESDLTDINSQRLF